MENIKTLHKSNFIIVNVISSHLEKWTHDLLTLLNFRKAVGYLGHWSADSKIRGVFQKCCGFWGPWSSLGMTQFPPPLPCLCSLGQWDPSLWGPSLYLQTRCFANISDEHMDLELLSQNEILLRKAVGKICQLLKIGFNGKRWHSLVVLKRFDLNTEVFLPIISILGQSGERSHLQKEGNPLIHDSEKVITVFHDGFNYWMGT